MRYQLKTVFNRSFSIEILYSNLYSVVRNTLRVRENVSLILQ